MFTTVAARLGHRGLRNPGQGLVTAGMRSPALNARRCFSSSGPTLQHVQKMPNSGVYSQLPDISKVRLTLRRAGTKAGLTQTVLA